MWSADAVVVVPSGQDESWLTLNPSSQVRPEAIAVEFDGDTLTQASYNTWGFCALYQFVRDSSNQGHVMFIDSQRALTIQSTILAWTYLDPSRLITGSKVAPAVEPWGVQFVKHRWFPGGTVTLWVLY